MVTGMVMVAPRLERTVISVGGGLTPTWVYERSPAGAAIPVAIGSAAPISPKPTSVSTAAGSLVVALTSRRARLTRHVAAAAVSVSVAVGLSVTATSTNADELPHEP